MCSIFIACISLVEYKMVVKHLHWCELGTKLVLGDLIFVTSCSWLFMLSTSMALITISGYPCSGKSTRARQLLSFLNTKLCDGQYNGPKYKVTVLSDDELNISRNVYSGTSAISLNLLDHGSQNDPILQTAVQRNQLEERCSQLCSGTWDRTPFSSSTQ